MLYRSISHYENREKLCSTYRKVAFCAVVMSTVACITCSIVLPTLYSHAIYSHHKIASNMNSCMSRVTVLWKELVITRTIQGHMKSSTFMSTNRTQREANDTGQYKNGIWAFGKFLPFKKPNDETFYDDLPSNWDQEDIELWRALLLEYDNGPHYLPGNPKPPQFGADNSYISEKPLPDLPVYVKPPESSPPQIAPPPSSFRLQNAPSPVYSRPPPQTPFHDYDPRYMENQHPLWRIFSNNLEFNINEEKPSHFQSKKSCCTCQRGLGGLPGIPGNDGLPGNDGRDGKNGTPGRKSQPIKRLRVKMPDCVSCISGSRGPSGPSGWKGPPGLPGDNGLPGDIYLMGSPGRTGIPGEAGDSGTPGRKGFRGNPGKLIIRELGLPGPSGHFGRKGKPGKHGIAGKDGNFGSSGSEGFIGDPGYEGVKGYSGTEGPNGLQGQRGLPGHCDHCPLPKLADGYGLKIIDSYPVNYG